MESYARHNPKYGYFFIHSYGLCLKHYNLDAIISVGYRVQSHTATRFRQWATRHLSEFIVKGFVLDDERLKNPDQPFDYFDKNPLETMSISISVA